MFPQISHIDDLLPHIDGNQQIRVKVEPNGITVVCYMLQDEDTFAGENFEYARECRGIAFHADGKIAARTLTKFFNIGENESVQPQNLSWSKVARIMEKRDGSMVTPVLLNGSALFKTKKTFDSVEAKFATELLHRIDNDQRELEWVRNCLLDGLTPTFELTSPRFPIVVRYEKDELTLLHIRVTETGEYLTEQEIMLLKPPFPIVTNQKSKFCAPGVPANLVSWELLRKAAEETEGIEGWVIQFDDGEMVKLKTSWYQRLHHHVVFSRWRDIARSVCADQADDLKGHFAMVGRSIEPILKVEREIKRTIDLARGAAEVHAFTGRTYHKTAKEMALMNKGHPLFGQIMKLFRGQEVDWMAWYIKTHLDEDWSLEVVSDAVSDE